MLLRINRSVRSLAARLRGQDGFLATLLPAVAGSMGAIVVADLFVQYPKYETRLWFAAILVVMLHFTAQRHDRAS